MPLRKHILSNLRMRSPGQPTESKRIARPSPAIKGYPRKPSSRDLEQKSILCFMMAVSCFVRGDTVAKDARPKKLAAPMYFEFGLQIYNSVFNRPLWCLIQARPPMEMAAFANDTYKISSGDQGLYVRHRSKLTTVQVLGFAAQCFNSAFTWGHQDWR